MCDLHLHQAIERTIHVEIQPEAEKVLMVGCAHEHPIAVDANFGGRGFGRAVSAAIERSASKQDAGLDAAIELKDPIEAVDVVADPAIPRHHQLARVAGVAIVFGLWAGPRPKNAGMSLIQGHYVWNDDLAGFVLGIWAFVVKE